MSDKGEQDLFEKEKEVIDRTSALLEEKRFPDEETTTHFEILLKAYKKLFRHTRRLVRISDRNEESLTGLAKSLDEKNKVLEALSVKLSKYLSPQVYDSIFAGDREVSLTTERKKLTVFFSDIVDFSKTTENLQPEDLTFLLNNYFSAMSKIALEHGATIDKFVGDAMMMFFGDPESRGVREDAEACINMAMAMQRRMKLLREEWHEKGYKMPFRMRIGINTGFCNVGNFGSDSRMDYTIIGSDVNLASRLEGRCPPGAILMSPETYALVHEMVEAEEYPPIEAKGFHELIRPYAMTDLDGWAEEHNDGLYSIRDQGLLLSLDLVEMDDARRSKAMDALQNTIEYLKKLEN